MVNIKDLGIRDHLLCLQSFLFGFWLLSLFTEGPGKNVLERSSVEQITDLILGERLLYQQTEQNGVSKLSEVVEELKHFSYVMIDSKYNRINM